MKSNEEKEKSKNEKVLAATELTLDQMHDSATKRISLITKEFSECFEFIENYPKSVTFFGSSLATEENAYYQLARTLGDRIATELQYTVMTGGGPGIMEAANRGAFEAKGKSVGITIKLPHEQVTNPYLTDALDITYFFARKVCLSFSVETYIFFPGGFGTLDELFEILTLVQTKKIESVPIILVGSEYWKPLETFIRNEVLSRKMIDSEDINLFKIEDDLDVILSIIKKAPIRNGIAYAHE